MVVALILADLQDVNVTKDILWIIIHVCLIHVKMLHVGEMVFVKQMIMWLLFVTVTQVILQMGLNVILFMEVYVKLHILSHLQ